MAYGMSLIIVILLVVSVDLLATRPHASVSHDEPASLRVHVPPLPSDRMKTVRVRLFKKETGMFAGLTRRYFTKPWRPVGSPTGFRGRMTVMRRDEHTLVAVDEHTGLGCAITGGDKPEPLEEIRHMTIPTMPMSDMLLLPDEPDTPAVVDVLMLTYGARLMLRETEQVARDRHPRIAALVFRQRFHVIRRAVEHMDSYAVDHADRPMLQRATEAYDRTIRRYLTPAMAERLAAWVNRMRA